MIQIKNCLTCKECCRFTPFAGKKFSLKEMENHFSFTGKLCDTFFNKTEGKYLIASHCKQNKDGKCSIYTTSDFPFACAIYPFLLATDKKGKYKLLIDRNCPSWRDVLNNTEGAMVTIKKYSENNMLDTFPEADLRRMGYKLLTVLKDVIF